MASVAFQSSAADLVSEWLGGGDEGTAAGSKSKKSSKGSLGRGQDEDEVLQHRPARLGVGAKFISHAQVGRWEDGGMVTLNH